MMTTTPRRPKRLLRTHLPALKGKRLEWALSELDASALPVMAKQQLRAMLQAAANPNAERVDVVITTLPPERRAEVEQAAADVARTMHGAVTRGASGLMDMSDDEWQRLVDESNAN